MRPFAAAAAGGMAPRRAAILILALAARGYAADEATKEDEDNTTKPYVAPPTEGLHWVETFDGDVWSRWATSKAEKYNGAFKVEKRTKEALIGDLGLLVPEEAKHYGVAATFPPLEGAKGVPFVVQFEVKFQDSLTCGGSYIKLYDSDGAEASEFKDDTRYVIMFGPDRCGATDKIHFILQHKSPKTGKWEEKHCQEPPSVPHDNLSHLYGLVIKPDNSFEIFVDGVSKTSGNLLTSMQPPVNPPKEIDDPTDSKPEDWVDNAKMSDPSATKPDDWDEDAPARIPDPKASKPEGWNDDAEKRIPDPSASQPSDWDDDEDGEWEPPIIDNPACKVGCGKWEPPMISNPVYKGKWSAPMIDNPKYIGVWKPKQIPNPDFFMDETPAILPKISGIGIDIWTMSKGIMFDNIVVATDAAKAKAFADQSWKIRKEIEDLQAPKPPKGGFWSSMGPYIEQYGLPAGITFGVIVLSIIFFCCCRSGASPPPPTPKKKEKKKKEEGQETTDEAKAAEEKKEEPAETKETPKAEGGLGDISKED